MTASDLGLVAEIENRLGLEASDRTVLTTKYCSAIAAGGWRVVRVEAQQAYHEVTLAKNRDLQLHVSQDYNPRTRRAIRVSPSVTLGGVDVVSSDVRTHGYASANKASRWRGEVAAADLEAELAALDLMLTTQSECLRVFEHRPSDAARRRVALSLAEAHYGSQQEMIAAQLYNTHEWGWARGDARSLLRAATVNLRDGGLRRHEDGKQPTRRVAGLLRRTEISRATWRAFADEMA